MDQGNSEHCHQHAHQFPVPGASTGHGTALCGSVQTVIELASTREVLAIGHIDSASEYRGR